MSVKIYTAWRIPQARLNDFLELAWQQAAAQIIPVNVANRTQLAQWGEQAEKDGIDIGFKIWHDRRHFYIIPYGWTVATDITPPDYAEDYHYHSNSERTPSVTARQWAARAETWDRVFRDDWHETMMIHRVIDFTAGIDWRLVNWWIKNKAD